MANYQNNRNMVFSFRTSNRTKGITENTINLSKSRKEKRKNQRRETINQQVLKEQK